MALWVKVFAAKPNSMNLILGPAWWKERTDSCKSSNIHVFIHVAFLLQIS